ncbi:MAG: hypothetical protein KatS3mg085_049 [Candidatus Dojkabacteria bacterium]|nr:MAG: hypothetical protein KatS3mg085_049 [Candidatus Dojkabacteria bacterium]
MDNIAIIGTGYVGLSTAAILANVGYKVWAVDVDESKIQTIKKGKSYFYEPGIDSFIESGIKTGNLISTVNHKEALQNCKIVFSCVGTPDLPDGSTDLRYVFEVAGSCC